MLASARQQALALERDRQRQYRENLIIDIEAEVERRKVRAPLAPRPFNIRMSPCPTITSPAPYVPCQAAWDIARQSQLAALRVALSRSLAMVGDGQKQAVDSILSARETASRHDHAWRNVAKASVQRQKNAQAVELELRAAQVRSMP
jgi:hypothetical protein